MTEMEISRTVVILIRVCHFQAGGKKKKKLNPLISVGKHLFPCAYSFFSHSLFSR